MVAWVAPGVVYAGTPLSPDFPENCEYVARQVAADALLTVGYPDDVRLEIVARHGSPDTVLLREAASAAIRRGIARHRRHA